ncbi:peptide MFS transporter [Hydromonas duriensis]|uniref:POT family proton-dependent oligopeptide transporter n=1 Tax=Hydromonas duriensis TaxID=1527608 RepID=A0A4R6Y821_9BURK|nr:peptide MFS transporter [Hydromonas duriensis]TDR31518.1 POT family proton-dependent oligopeptide transporter [Hydromonas duriensis]
MSTTSRYPAGLGSLFFAEMWERFSYYGMRAILVLFLVDQVTHGGMGLEKGEAAAIYGLYTAGVYILALPGGWVADRFWGAKKSIIVGGAIIMLGHILLAVSSDVRSIFFFGLFCIAVGTGLLKPNISSIVGSLYDKNDIGGRDAGFSLFYMGINLGAILGGFVVGYLGESINWHLGFGTAAVAMFLGLVNFIYANNRSLAGKGEKPTRNPTAALLAQPPTNKGLTVAITLTFAGLVGVLAATKQIDLFSAVGLAKAMGVLIVGVAIAFFLNIFLAGGLTADEKKRMVVLAVLFFGAALFWSGFEQAGSSLSIFASDMTQRQFGDAVIPASWFQNLNPFFILVLTPFVAKFWITLQNKGVNISVFTKFGIALIMLGLGYLILVPAAKIGLTGVKVSVLFLTATFFIHTIAELLLSPVGLSTFSRLAPERFTSQLMGFWFVAASLGNLMAGLLAAGMDTESPTGLPDAFTQMCMTSVAFGVALLLLAKPITKWALNGKEMLEESSTSH